MTIPKDIQNVSPVIQQSYSAVARGQASGAQQKTMFAHLLALSGLTDFPEKSDPNPPFTAGKRYVGMVAATLGKVPIAGWPTGEAET